MKRLLIDTNAYAAFKKNEQSAVNALCNAEYIGINAIVIGELLCGFKGGSKEKQNKQELDVFLDSPRVEMVKLDEDTPEFFAQIYWLLKKKGKPVPTNDMWIAASAMMRGLALFTYDRHFQNIDGLMLYQQEARWPS